ncbi:TldD/PmbA family protein [Thermosynechococcus sp.]|uniref:TldD/PmbA family protein n=1 Tax=Thermosynechococcus sp. TaxID=2814275 RepID=UPI00391AA605
MTAPNLAAILNQVDLPLDWLGLRYVEEIVTTRSARDGQPQTNQRSRQRGVMVEVLVNGQFAYTATPDLRPPAIHRAIQQAYQQAKMAAPWRIFNFTPAARGKGKGYYRSPQQQPFEQLSAAELNHLLKDICHSLKVSDKIVQTRAFVQTVVTTSHWLSSDGSHIEQQFYQVLTDMSATAQGAGVVQQRTDHGWLARCYQGGLEWLRADQLSDRARQIGEQAVELLSAAECPDTTTTLVLAADQMMLQIHESIGHPLELDRILGDERNYAGSSFIRLEDFGQRQYGSPLLNVTFDPTVRGELASYAFDDLGALAERIYLIKEGRLLRGLGSLESQQRAGVPGVASARACSWNRPPIDRMANLNIEPGTQSFAEIIGNIEAGVYMESNRSWSIDDYRLKFQFGCEYAKLIENGRLTRTLRNPNYRGTTPEFWQNLIAVGDASTFGIFGTPFCGKGEPNQAIRVGHASPVCAFANIQVFGGG